MSEIALMCAHCGHVKMIVETWPSTLIHQLCPECKGPMGPLEDLLRRRAENRHSANEEA